MAKELNVLAISYAKRVLENGSREQQRMQAYADATDIFTIIVFTKKKDGLSEVYRKGNLTIYGTNTYTRIGMLYKAYMLGRNILKENSKKYWIVSNQDPFATSIVGRALARARQCAHHVQVHGDPFSKEAKKSIIQRLWNIFGIQTLRTASKIRTVSYRAKQSIIALGIPESKVTVLPIQHDITNFLTVGNHRQYQEKDICTFLYVGRLSAEKNIQNIIEAFAKAYTKNSNLRLQIVGSGTLLHSLQMQAQKCDIAEVVLFIPWAEDVSQRMAKADVLVLASAHEGYGMVLVEAMASGLPIITTDVGCVGEIVIASKHALVVPHDDTNTYAQAMLTLASDIALRTKFGTCAYSDVQKSMPTQAQYIQKWKDSFGVT